MKLKITSSYKAIVELTKKRRLILDGTMDAQIKKFKLKKRHYGDTISGRNINALNLTQPKIIEKIHNDYLNSGADVLTANTFYSDSVPRSCCGNPHNCDKLNERAILIARRTALKHSFHNKRRVFVSSSVGPSDKILSYVHETIGRNVVFNKLSALYKLQMNMLLNFKVDILLLKSVSDTLNAKAAILAYLEMNTLKQRLHPLVISVTVNDISGSTLSNQTLSGFWYSINHSNPLGIGLNCSLGGWNSKKHVMELFQMVGKPIWMYLDVDNKAGKYIQDDVDFNSELRYLTGMTCALGGGAGSTPEDIAKFKPFVNIDRIKYNINQDIGQNDLHLSNLKSIKISKNGFYKISGTTNVLSSFRFGNMIVSGDYEGILNIIRQQVINGAQIININIDDILINSEYEILKIINLINLDPDLAELPIMIDSANWKTLLVVMKCTQGKCIVSAISLKDGDKAFIEKAQIIRMHGCIPVITAIDEVGQATTIEHRLQICKRASILLIKHVGFNCEELIFDLNTFAIFTGIPEHDNSALELIRSIKLIKSLFPQFNFISRVSDLSFLFKGNTRIRESLHCVFLKHAIVSGLNLGIVDTQNQMNYFNLNSKVKLICEALILNTIHLTIKNILNTFNISLNDLSLMWLEERPFDDWRKWNVWHRIMHAIINSIDEYIESDSIELANSIGPMQVIEGPLTEGARIVVQLFNKNKVPSSRIRKTIEIIKRIILTVIPLIKTKALVKKSVILLVTIKSDVSDIEKYIVSTLLICNNCEVIDLSIVVSAYDIVKFAIKYKANVICILGSTLLSLDEITQLVVLLNRDLINIPLLILGTMVNKLYAIIYICPEYIEEIMVYISDINDVVNIILKLLKGSNIEFVRLLKTKYKFIANESKVKQNRLLFQFDKNIWNIVIQII